MDFDQLTTFIEIAKLGSFSRAGQKLFRSQPAVSAQVRQLEQEYGEKLFDRGRKSVRLTSAGETLFEYAVRMVNLRAIFSPSITACILRCRSASTAISATRFCRRSRTDRSTSAS
jgi:hypothetical protein